MSAVKFLIESFLLLDHPTIEATKDLVEDVNKGLSDVIDFIPFTGQKTNTTSLHLEEYKDNLWYTYPTKSTVIKLSNYNKLSDKVDSRIRDWVFEFVDYVKRHGITNFDGKITFAHNKNYLYIRSIEISEIPLKEVIHE